MKKSILAVMALVCVLALAACSTTGTIDPNNTASNPAVSVAPPAGSLSNETISGTVNANTEDTIELMTADGRLFRFLTTGIEMVTPDDGVAVGDDVMVHYTGTLDESQDTQTVLVTRIEVAEG